MKSLFKNIETYQKYIKILKSADFENLLNPFEQDALNKYIFRYLDKTTYQTILDYYHHVDYDENSDSKNNQLLVLIQRALSRFTLFLASPSLDINIGTTGFTTSSTQQLVPASNQRVQKLDKSLEQLGFDSIETMLIFLEENKSHFNDWATSDCYTMHLRNLINTTSEFQKHYNINFSRLTFLGLRPEINKIEKFYIIPSISKDLYDSIFAKIKAKTTTGIHSELLSALQATIVNFVVGTAEQPIPPFRGDTIASQKNVKYQQDAYKYLEIAIKIIEDNPEDFPDYPYHDDPDDTDVNENSNIFFSMGGAI